jgi:dTDP-4-amino-4,6-dideoxygalactose transaminase
MITKTPIRAEEPRSFELHPNARTAFSKYLRDTKHVAGDSVLLPAYIGWSAKEGSGVFDPIAELGLKAEFYRLDHTLRIDIEQLKRLIEGSASKTLVIIHYFGYVDPGYETVIAVARAAGLNVIEDEAHAMLSDLIGGTCGRFGDACIYSLHKLLPVSSGGMLVRNRAARGDCFPQTFCNHDLAAISTKRRQNALALAGLVQDLGDELTPLFDWATGREVPQTFPVRLRRANRNGVYQDMNEAGFGVVSLYHTMIAPITHGDFPDAVSLSRQILNLPVHQDATAEDMAALVNQLKRSLVRNRI